MSSQAIQEQSTIRQISAVSAAAANNAALEEWEKAKCLTKLARLWGQEIAQSFRESEPPITPKCGSTFWKTLGDIAALTPNDASRAVSFINLEILERIMKDINEDGTTIEERYASQADLMNALQSIKRKELPVDWGSDLWDAMGQPSGLIRHSASLLYMPFTQPGVTHNFSSAIILNKVEESTIALPTTRNSKERYECPEPDCTKSYVLSTGLRNHIKVDHKGEKYQCPNCRKVSKYHYKMQEHVKRCKGKRVEEAATL